MTVTHLPGAAVDLYLRLVRLPMDGAIGLLPGRSDGAGSAARLTLDRADAGLRVMLGGVLNDPVLLEDATRRRVAAEERVRARRLRARAEDHGEQAADRLARTHQEAESRRRGARRAAQAAGQEAERQREEKSRRAAQVQSRRKATSHRAAAQRDEAVDQREPRARLEALDAEAQALALRENALAAKNEARRLRQAASATKARRKRSTT